MKKKNDITKLRVGCCFAGIGGFAKAFEKEGFVTKWAIEIEKSATEIFKINFPQTKVFNQDIKKVGTRSNVLCQVDVITGGFPCQPFSRAGLQKGIEDPRSGAIYDFFKFLTMASHLKPVFILLENVKDILSIQNGKFFQGLKTEFYKCGFYLSESTSYLLDSFKNAGIPQFRERLFLVAIRKDIASEFDYPLIVPEQKAHKLFSERFLNNKQKINERYYFKSDSPYYTLFQKEYKAVRNKKTVFLLRRNYVRSNKRGICFTLVASMGTGGHNVPVIKDKWGFRRLTPQECAKLQGWESLKLPNHLKEKDIYKAIGNSVVVDVVQILVKHIKKNLLKNAKRL